MSTAVPTVNVLMTYDPLQMIEFQKAANGPASLALFREKASEVDTYIFSNAPQSNFLSLIHDFGLSQGEEDEGNTSSPHLTLEFVDPRGLFDSNVDFSPRTLIDTKADLVAQQLKKKRAEALGLFNQSYAVTANPLFPILPKAGFCELVADSVDLEWLQSSVDELEQDIKDLEELTLGENFDVDDPQGPTQALKAANKLLWAHKQQLVRPVYITYGIGDNLADWCPPMVFNNAIGMEFSFNATGGRVMKISYTGVSDKPLLTPMGIMPLGTIGLGAVINGTSRRLFNGSAQLILQKDYPYATGAVGNIETIDPKKVVKPDLHKIITDTLKDFLEKAINSHKPAKASNVVVLFPNLDILLSGYFDAEFVSVKASNSDADGDIFGMFSTDEEELTGDMVWNIETTCEVLEGLGFTISCSKHDYKGRVGDSIYNELERQVDDIAVFNWLAGGRAVSYEYDTVLGTSTGAHPASPESVLAWLGDRDIRCEMQTDGLIKSVENTVDDICNRIKDRIMEYSAAQNAEGDSKAVPALDITRYIETDYNTLSILHKHGLIEDPNQPALIFGDDPTIREIIDGGLFEIAADLKKKYPEWDVTQDDAVAESLTSWGEGTAGSLSRYDIEDGWSSEVVRDMYDLIMPIPWLGPFGPTGEVDANMENFLPGDVNLDSDSWTVLKTEQPHKAARVPIFSFGTKNPNILELNYDINKQYYGLLGIFDFINMSSFQRTNAILGTSTRAAQEACNLLSKVKDFQTIDFKGNVNADGIPLPFVALVQPMWNRLQVSQGGSAVGSADWEKIFTSLNIDLVADLAGKEFENQAAYVEFMWKAFSSLTNGDYKRIQVQQSGANNVAAALTRWTHATEMLSNMAIVATIKTTPMFHLATKKRVVNRQSIILGIEPRYSGIDKSVVVPTSTWFSGLYVLTGFKHTLSKDAVHSEFALNKPANSGGYLNSGN